MNRCPAIRKTDVLSFGNLDKTPVKTLKFDAHKFKHRSIDFIVRFVGEIKEAIFCLPLFIFIIYCKALGFLAILSIVWETFLKSRNAVVIWQSADEAYRVHDGTVVAALKHKCLAFLNILTFSRPSSHIINGRAHCTTCDDINLNVSRYS